MTAALASMLGAVGAGPFTMLALLVFGVTGAMFWSGERSARDASIPFDGPARVLGWVLGWLPADRLHWGWAMVGELDRIEGRRDRWQFALGCALGVVLWPPRRFLGPIGGLLLMAFAGSVAVGVGFIHFGMAAAPGNWVVLTVVVVLLAGAVVGANVLVRRPAVVAPGLVGGVLLVATWLAFSHLTFMGIMTPDNSMGAWSNPALFIAVPVIVGAGSTAWTRSTNAGRAAARLAGFGGGLATFLLSTVAAMAIDGGPRDPGVGIAGGVSEAFSNAAIQCLIFLPLMMATIGWVAATATARLVSIEALPLGPARAVSPSASESGRQTSVRSVGHGKATAATVGLVVAVIATPIAVLLIR
jgi:hypothetical protein